jgi:HSP20 family protein
MASFFEKLTGSTPLPKSQASQKPEPKSEQGPEVDVPFVADAGTDAEYEIDAAAARGGTAVREKEKEKEKKDWSALQTEGQLTVDIYEQGNSIIIQSAVAGTDPDDLDITLTHDMITIKGTRKQVEEVKEDNYFYRELYWGSFSRSVILPEEVDSDKAEASIKNGILTIKLPKKTRGGQKLKVKSE